MFVNNLFAINQSVNQSIDLRNIFSQQKCIIFIRKQKIQYKLNASEYTLHVNTNIYTQKLENI